MNFFKNNTKLLIVGVGGCLAVFATFFLVTTKNSVPAANDAVAMVSDLPDQGLAPTVELDESLAATAEAGESAAPTVEPDESLAATAEADVSVAPTVEPDESLAATAEAGESTAPTVELDESLAATAEAGESAAPTVELDESLAATAEAGESATPTVELDESLAPTAEAGESAAPTVELDESLAATAEVGESATPTVELDESLAPTAEADESLAATAEADVSAAPTVEPVQDPPEPVEQVAEDSETKEEIESVVAAIPQDTGPSEDADLFVQQDVALPDVDNAVVENDVLAENLEPIVDAETAAEVASLRDAPSVDSTPEAAALPAVSAEPAPQTGQAPESIMPEVDDNVVNEPIQSNDPLPVLSATTLTLQTARPPDAAPDLTAITPRFDLVRVDPNGTTLVAGQAEPNVTVTIISDGEILAETQSSPSGEFVAFLTADIAQPQPIELPSDLRQTNAIVSQAQVVILPNQENPETAPLVVLATQDKVEVIQPLGLSVPDNVSLDSISYDVDGNVVLAGRGAPGRWVWVYADDIFQSAAPIGGSGSWDVSLTGLDAGRYVLRVDEVLPDDSVASRVESPFQREFPEALALTDFAQGTKVIVQPGNTLWLMATQAYGDGDYYTQIFSANEEAIRDPDLIYPGQVFSIPSVSE